MTRKVEPILSSNFRFVSYFAINETKLITLRNTLENSDLWSSVGASSGSITNFSKSGFLMDKSQYIVSVLKYPFDIKNVILKGLAPSEETIGVAHTPLVDSNGNYVSGYDIAIGLIKSDNKNNNILNLGSYLFTRTYNDFRDYSPYKKCRLWLPYYGFVELNLNDWMQERMNIKYILNMSDGSFQWVLERESPIPSPTDTTIVMSGQGQIGIAVPFNFSNGAINRLKKFDNIVNMGESFAQGQNKLKIANTYSYNNIIANQPHIQKNGGNDVYSMWYLPQKPFLEFSEQDSSQNDYGHYLGYPSSSQTKLSNISSGKFVSIQECHLENFDGATREELNDILSALENGVII